MWTHTVWQCMLRSQKKAIQEYEGDFPGGPVAKTPHSQCGGPGFNPWSGKEIPYATSKAQWSQMNKYNNDNNNSKEPEEKRIRLENLLGGTPHFTHQPGWGIAGVQHRDQSQCQHPGVALRWPCPFFFSTRLPPSNWQQSLTSKAEKGKKIFCLRLPFREVRNLSSWRG